MDIDEVLKLEVKRGEILVIKSDDLDESTLLRIKQQLSEKMGYKVMILAIGTEDSVLTLPKEQAIALIKKISEAE